MKRFAVCVLFLAATAYTACGIEDKGGQDLGSLPDAVVDNTPMPDQSQPDLTTPDVPLTDTAPEVEPDQGVDTIDVTPDVQPEPTPDVQIDTAPEIPVCVPDCKGEACGDDGCGGECATCPVLPCRGTSECVGGTCNYKQVTCDDGDACTTEYCYPVENRCIYEAVKCDDGDACTTDSCDQDKGCVYTPKSCDDGNACTTDSCDSATGLCQYTHKACNDGLDYTVDSCDPATGACEFTVKTGTCLKDTDCTDGNPCTADVCDSVTHQCKLVEIVCNDNNACTTEKCVPAPVGMYEYFCETTEMKDCNDGNACTYDDCDPTTGACSHEAVSGCCNSNDDCAADAYCDYGQCWNLGCPKSDECWVYTATGHECQSAVLPEGTFCGYDKVTDDKMSCDNAGNCVVKPACTTDTDCTDGNIYTQDVCDKTNKVWECKHFPQEFAFWCSVPTEWQATGRYCEVWVGFGTKDSLGNPTQDVFLLKENGEKLSAEQICETWWTPWKVQVNVRVFGPGIDQNTAPWVSGSYAKMADPAGTSVPLEVTTWGYPTTPNWGTKDLPWCK